MSLLELFYHVDNFWKAFRPHWYRQLLAHKVIKRVREPQLSVSEIMTIIIRFLSTNPTTVTSKPTTPNMSCVICAPSFPTWSATTASWN